MAFNFVVSLRVIQFVFAIIVLGTAGYGLPFPTWPRLQALFIMLTILILGLASYYQDNFISSPQFSFLIFCGVWTAFIVLPYLTLAPRFYSAAASKFVVLAAEAVSMIFWLAGFIAGAAFMVHFAFCNESACSSARAGVVFAAFQWVLFTATTAMATIHVVRTGDERYESSAKNIQHQHVTNTTA